MTVFVIACVMLGGTSHLLYRVLSPGAATSTFIFDNVTVLSESIDLFFLNIWDVKNMDVIFQFFI